MRIISQNINSLQIFNEFKLNQLFQSLRKHKIDISLLTEMNVNERNNESRNIIHNISRMYWPSSASNITSTKAKNAIVTHRGRAMTMIHGTLSERVKTKSSDPIGRWNSIALFRPSAPPIVVVYAYMPCYNSQPGITTYNHNIFKQHNGINKIENVKKKCWEELEEFITKLTKDAGGNHNRHGCELRHTKHIKCSITNGDTMQTRRRNSDKIP